MHGGVFVGVPFLVSLRELTRLQKMVLGICGALSGWQPEGWGPLAALPYVTRPQHFLYFLPLPHGQGSLGPVFVAGSAGVSVSPCSRIWALR